MEGRGHPYFVLFVFHLAMSFVQGNNPIPTAVILSSNSDSTMELQTDKVDINPTTVADYGPNNVAIQYTGDRKELWEGRGEIIITCNADCNPRCNYWIRHNGRDVSTGKAYAFSMDRKKSGEYSCAARNSVSTSASFSKTIMLDIKYGPTNVTIQYTSDRDELWEGDGKISITCNADCNPQCNRWRLYHNRRWLSSKQTYTFAMYRENSGQYSCTARNSVSTPAISSNSITFNIKYGPTNVTIQYTSDRDELWEGDGKISITCNADCNPQCNRWSLYHNRHWLSSKKTYTFAMDRENSGQYSCTARNSVQGTNVKSSNTVRLHLKYKTVRLSPIKKILLDVNRNLPSNVVCTIDCNYEGCDSSTITVLRNSEVYNTIDTNQSIFPSRQALVSDDGIYKCKLSDNTESHENFQLAILYGPRNLSIMKGRGNADAEIVLIEWDSGTSLTCSADCNPACKTSWYKDGQLLSHQQHKTIHITSDRRESGNYKCEASGVEGTVSSTQVKITVQLCWINNANNNNIELRMKLRVRMSSKTGYRGIESGSVHCITNTYCVH
ncbi:carcinoembryonic antigen-related cell adhesion molecule 5-like [Ostrea edulis]|uniref:carcinoembryonic antigen-related cell adhesion molecule 5-like n=1 Tax=Ostrea edulis TaxID=37623 RepID=UPI0024AF2AC9|nr:carcinoembryonic antigen-related cell adhesion molecule 5-like [Ostrea edulis]